MHHSPHRPRRYRGDTLRMGCADLIERDLRLGFEPDILRHMRLFPPCRIICPCLRQIEPVSDRQACRMIGDRQRNRDLTIVLFASRPQYCRATPTECVPFFVKPVSSTIQASIRPCRSMPGKPARGFFAKRPRPTRAPGRPDVKAIDVWRKPGPAPRSPPSARRSCVRPASAGQRNNHLRAQRDRRGR